MMTLPKIDPLKTRRNWLGPEKQEIYQASISLIAWN
jgi:hypothetical protein